MPDGWRENLKKDHFRSFRRAGGVVPQIYRDDSWLRHIYPTSWKPIKLPPLSPRGRGK
jgi:hypothetical protein